PDRLVDAWLVHPGADDPDVFLESIDYEGVRAQLRSLLATRLAYALTDATTSADPLAVQAIQAEPTAAWIKIARLAGDVPPDAPLSPPLSEPSLAGGMTLQRDGDYDAAADLFRAAAQSPDASLAAEANLRLGQALLAAGRPADAL